MAGVLEAMGFPREWCERAVGMSGGIEPAVELLLQWQADGEAGVGAGAAAVAVEMAAPAVSSVTTSAAASGLDAVVPDAGGDGRNSCVNAAERSETVGVGTCPLDRKALGQGGELGEKDSRRRCRLAATSVAASGSHSRDDMSAAPVELQIRCSNYSTIKGTFRAGSTLKEVRDFLMRELQTHQQLEQPVGLPLSGATINRPSRRTSRMNGTSAILPSDRITQRTRKASRYANPSSSAAAPRNAVATGNVCFLIPFPRMVFDTEASMETTLFDANLYPRGILTVQFQAKEGPSTSDHVKIPSVPLDDGLGGRNPPTSVAQLSGDRHVSRRAEDVAMREQRLKATLDRYKSKQDSRNVANGVVEARVAAAPLLVAPGAPSSSALGSSMAGSLAREERTLELDGERVRHRELALQAAAKRMTEAAQLFREGFMSDEGEPGGGFCTPSDVQPVTAATGNDVLTRVVVEDQDSKGKQVADCGPSSSANQLAEGGVHDLGSTLAGFRGRPPRARLPLPSPSSARPEKMPRTDEASSTSSAGANHVPPLFTRRGEEPAPFGRWIRGSPGSGSSSVSELRIRLEDGSVLRHTFPAYTTLQSVCEFALLGRFSAAEYGLILPMSGSIFHEGEALSSTLEEVGLVPSGVVLLQKVASRGLVTQGTRRARRMIRYLQSGSEPEPELEQLWQDFSRHMNTNLTYEELVELEDSIGRVNVGVPEPTIANLPTHTVSRSVGDICIVCLSEMVEGEEVMVLPCLHTFHPACIRQWLLQSTCCPTCKHYIT